MKQKEAFYATIYDTGGIDTIAHKGGHDAHIDLLAATLDYTPTGGGVVSFISGTFGGFTIADGVVIENATGGNGNDVLLGNSASNTLTGNNGNDSLVGREGSDVLLGGNGKDVLNGGAGNDTLNGGNGEDVFVFDTAGTDTIVGYQRGEIFDLTALDVTWADVTISKTSIRVDLDGSDDLTILLASTAGITSSSFLFG